MTSEPTNNDAVNSFIAELRRPEAPASLSQREHLQKIGSSLLHLRENYDVSKLIEVCAESAVESLPLAVGFKKSFLGSFLYHVTGEVAFLDLAMQGLREQKISVPYAMSELFALKHIRMVSGLDPEIDQKTFDCLWMQYTRIVEQIQNARPPVGLAQAINLAQGESLGSDRRAVVITEQLLAIGHAPTRIAVEVTKSLSLNHDMQVLLVNTAQYPSVPAGSILSLMPPANLKQYSQISSVPYGDLLIDIFQPANDGLGDEALISLVERIAAFDPSLIMVVGNACPLAELFSDTATVMQLPLSIDPPMTICNHFSLYLPPDERAGSMLRKMGNADNFLFVAAGGYTELSSSSVKTREELGLPERHFVYAVVGNRLANECDNQFFACLDTICSAGGIHIFFIGPYDDLESITNQYQYLRENCTHSEREQDLMAAYHQCNGYINPMRKGGGTSAVFAMQAGLPVLTLPKGDVAIAGSKFPQISSFDELADVAIRLNSDSDLYDRYRNLAFTGAQELTQFDDMINRFVGEYERRRLT